MRVAGCVLSVGVLLAVSGCYGSTEPPTKISFDGATLNARGTTNNGQAESWFELWATDAGGTPLQLGHQTWPGGVSGPISYDTQIGLLSNTGYSFRLCGNDVGGDPVCAQTRTFRTADGDTASGSIVNADGTTGVNFGASSGPHGERVAGSAAYFGSGREHPENVGCLKVSGNRAIVGTRLGLFLVTDADPMPTPHRARGPRRRAPTRHSTASP